MMPILPLRRLCFAAVLLSAVYLPAAMAAPDVSLQVTHFSSTLGADGVLRTSQFSERVVRAGNTVWVERVLPAGTNADHDHASLKGAQRNSHRHADLSAASRWVEWDGQSKLALKVVSHTDNMVVSVPPTDYGNVGFDGSWLAAYHLIDPALLKKLKPGAKTPDAQWFEAAKTKTTTGIKVLWNSNLEIPMQVVSESAQGQTTRTTTVKVLDKSLGKPWEKTSKFTNKDYSDFLD